MLEELDLEQDQVTIIYEDNDSNLLIKNKQQPTHIIRNMDIVLMYNRLGSIRPYYPLLHHNAHHAYNALKSTITYFVLDPHCNSHWHAPTFIYKCLIQ